MLLSLLRRFLTVAMGVVPAAAAQGASYSITPVFAGAFSLDASYTPLSAFDPANPSGPAYIQVDFLLDVDGFDADQGGFGNGVFTIGLENLTQQPASGWTPATMPPCSGDGAMCALVTNRDIGNPNDLKDIMISTPFPFTTSPSNDPWFQFGRGAWANYNVGSIVVEYQGGVSIVESAFTQASTLVWDGARWIGKVDPNPTFPLADLPIGRLLIGIPEPSTAVLTVIGLFAGVRRARV